MQYDVILQTQVVSLIVSISCWCSQAKLNNVSHEVEGVMAQVRHLDRVITQINRTMTSRPITRLKSGVMSPPALTNQEETIPPTTGKPAEEQPTEPPSPFAIAEQEVGASVKRLMDTIKVNWTSSQRLLREMRTQMNDRMALMVGFSLEAGALISCSEKDCTSECT